MLCFLLGLGVVIGVIAGLIVVMLAIGIPIFRVQEGEMPYAEDLSTVMSYGFVGLIITVAVVVLVVLCGVIGCGILGR